MKVFKSSLILIILMCILLAFAGCNKQPKNTIITINTFEDTTYPCLKVVFPEPIQFEDMDKQDKNGVTTIQYHVKMPSKQNYNISIVKRQSIETDWLLVPIADQYDNNVKFYEKNTEFYLDKSGVVVIAEKEGDIYLRGVVGQFVSNNDLYMVIVDRLIHKKEYLSSFSQEKWKNSAAGTKFIADMQAQLDWFYENSNAVSCHMQQSVDNFK